MDRELHALTSLAREVQRRRSLEDLLQTVVDGTAALLKATHGSIRLLNPSRSHLLAVCRSGEPLHLSSVPFARSEGLLGWIAENERPIRSADPERDPRFVPKPDHSPMGRFLGVPIVSGQLCVGVLSVLRGDPPFTEEEQDLLTLVAAISAPYLEIARLSRLSQVDPLTGALNRRGMEVALSEPLVRTDSPPASLMMVDIDHFKAINDRHGHAVGDEVLRHVARILAQVLRKSDEIVRYGGEEFLLVFHDVGVGRAMKIAERARAAVQDNPTPVGELSIAVTVSIGVAEHGPSEEAGDVVQRADAALYAAKNSGRNRVCSA